MNNKGNIFDLIFMIVCLFLVIGGIWHFIIKDEVKEYNEYKSFCKERPNFCYCSWGECEFKTSWNSIIGLDNNTIALCELANKLNNTKMIFKVGCNE